MNDDLVKVKMNVHYPRDSFAGLCGFYIKKPEVKMCPSDVYEHGESKGALVLVDAKIVPEKPVVAEEIKEEEEELDLIKEAKDIVDEGKDFLEKVTRSGRGKTKNKK